MAGDPVLLQDVVHIPLVGMASFPGWTLPLGVVGNYLCMGNSCHLQVLVLPGEEMACREPGHMVLHKSHDLCHYHVLYKLSATLFFRLY